MSAKTIYESWLNNPGLDEGIRKELEAISGDEKEIEEILDHIASYLSEEKQLVIDRPMIINDETTGEDVFYRYPYEEFVFTR